MARNFGWLVAAFCCIVTMFTLAFWPSNKGNVVVVKYDCSHLIGGWHPDIPVKVQEECRKRELIK